MEAVPEGDGMMESVRVPTVDGLSLAAVLSRGRRADVIIWLHGISVNKDEYLGFFRDGATRFKSKDISSIRFDFRGHGESDGSSLDFSVIAQILDLQAIMRLAEREFGLSARIHLVAASFGAPPAVFAAARYPTRVHSVSLIAPVLSYQRTFLNPETEWTRELFSAEKLQLLDETGRLYFDSAFCIGPRLVEEMRLLSPIATLASLRQPVLVIHGNRDSMVPYDATVQACSGLEHVRLVTLKGADHGFMQEGDEEGVSPQSVANKAKIFRLIEEQLGC